MWTPNLLDYEGPIYEKIAAALARDIASGVLPPGARLPTLKALAAALGVTPGTVNRAYEVAQRQGLVDGEVGRGTFVRGSAVAPASAPAAPGMPPPAAADLGNDWIDLSIIKPNVHLQAGYARTLLRDLAETPDLSGLLDYTPDGGRPRHREAGARWMQAMGMPARAEQVVLTAGSQHGLWVAVNALTRPDELVLCESLCYPGIASVVLSLGRRLKGVATDDQGMTPDALRAQCRDERPALTICIATCQNPTAGVMSVERRERIAAIAREFDFILVDDDIYGFLAPEPLPPLASFAPERSLYLTSLSKSALPSLRLGYVHGPAEWLTRLAASVRTSIWMVSPLAAQLATTLIDSGKARELASTQRGEAAARQLIARELLGHHAYRALPASYHLWLKLPPHWSSGEQFAALARSHKLIVAGGDSFAMNRDGEGRQYVRIALMGPTREQLRFALTKLAGLLSTPDAAWL
ncbi:MAG: PLP-dependent aminotransferase family protein [Rhodocyclales bacterium]|nr:PLP-dependent aminotransferase family protein [Rhodocyclales bacterium]